MSRNQKYRRLTQIRSKFEKEIYRQLISKHGKTNIEYEPYAIEYVIKHDYYPDFSVLPKNNDGYLLEAKGYFRPDAQRKMRAVKELHPELDIRLIFQNNGKIGKDFRYSDWAEKYDFKYAIGKIPKDW